MSPTAAKPRIRLQYLALENFKAFDKLEIDFPPPRMKNDPDVFVMGSKNGQGKTSLLEACCILLLAGMTDHEEFSLNVALKGYTDTPFDTADLLVHAGANEAKIKGSFVLGDKAANISLTLDRSGTVSIEGKRLAFQEYLRKPFNNVASTRDLAFLLAGQSGDPLLSPPLLYFHSYRKVQEGSPELGMMIDTDRPRRYRSRPGLDVTSTFKLDVLRSLMSKGGLFENLDDSEANIVLNKLNDLMRQYAGGYIEKLRPSLDNTIEFRVTPNNGGPSFTFDGLSSGQKEIISTLFLIWRYTQNQSGIVMIDEPELHLNPEWHRSFIRNLSTLSPNNQYLIATHSEDVFSAVDKDRRLLLVADGEPA